jgi:antitoxin (DNA-binding transcriptional repressor) of toxin-antitoxin stability system
MDSLFFLLNRVEQGEEVITKRRGKKVARLISPQKKGIPAQYEELPRLHKSSWKTFKLPSFLRSAGLTG